MFSVNLFLWLNPPPTASHDTLQHLAIKGTGLCTAYYPGKNHQVNRSQIGDNRLII
jgi:hypothetical protein